MFKSRIGNIWIYLSEIKKKIESRRLDWGMKNVFIFSVLGKKHISKPPQKNPWNLRKTDRILFDFTKHLVNL